jgi:transposase
VGHTPVLRCPLTRDHLSVISAVTPAGALYLAMQETAFTSEAVIAFVQGLMAHIAGKLLIVWDGAPIHRSHAIQRFLADGASERVWLERLPGYAPDLNPDEGIWHYLKQVELKNVCCADLAHLRRELEAATHRLQNKPNIIQGCFKQVGYYEQTG